MLPQQVITEQFVDAPIKHGVGVADFTVVAMVLHQTVRLQRVRTDLAAEADGILTRVLGLTGGIALAQFQIVEAPAQDAHGGILVVMLRALVLALDGDARGDVRDAHGGIRRVHALPAGAAGAEDVHAQIRFLDLDFDVVARVGDHIHRGKGSVAASRRVKGRNTDEAVDAALPFEEAIYVLAGNTQAHALDPGFVAGQEVQLLYGKTVRVRPTQVHALEHLRPVLRLRAARAGVDFENGVGVILFGRKEQVGFRFFEEFGEALDLRAQRLQRFGGISAFLDFRAAGKLLRHFLPVEHGGIAVLENVVNPTNIGAIFRSAAALHMDAVLLTSGCSDPLYRRAARVSMGTVFQIPWTYFNKKNVWPQDGMQTLQNLGFKTAAMALRDDSVGIDDKALRSEEKLAVILGTEGDGLASQTIADCDYTVKIPMSHGVDSLNVAAASAVAFWELGHR